MNLAYTINKKLSTNKIFKDIINLLNKIPQDEYENSILTVSLVKVQSMPPPNLPPTIEGSQHLSQPN